jgi:hypothetical protein
MPGPRFPSEYGLVRRWFVVWFCWYYSIFFYWVSFLLSVYCFVDHYFYSRSAVLVDLWLLVTFVLTFLNPHCLNFLFLNYRKKNQSKSGNWSGRAIWMHPQQYYNHKISSLIHANCLINKLKKKSLKIPEG